MIMRRGFLPVLFLSLAVAVSGCSNEPPALKVSVLRYGSQATAYVAQKHGFFKKHGLDVELVEVKSSGAAIIAQRSGSIDIVFTILGTVFSANERGFDLVALVQNEISRSEPPDLAAILVRADSPFRTLKDLAGAKIGVSGLHSQSHVSVLTSMRNAGLDPSTVSFMEMPAESQLGALLSGQLDAATVVDPYTTQAIRSEKARVISWPNIESVKGQPQAAMWAKRSWVEKNPDAARRFAAAMREAIDYMNADESRAIKEIIDYTGIDPKLVEGMPLNVFTYKVSRKAWQETIDMMAANGEIKPGHTPDEYFSEQILPDVGP